jgi:hypothetical protein
MVFSYQFSVDSFYYFIFRIKYPSFIPHLLSFIFFLRVLRFSVVSFLMLEYF